MSYTFNAKMSYIAILKKAQNQSDLGLNETEDVKESSSETDSELSSELSSELCPKTLIKHDDSYKLPGGKRYQKDGCRLEKAFYKTLPSIIKKNVLINVKPLHSNGNAIIEFDMIYMSDSSKRIISFEIKGVNKYTTNDTKRQTKLLEQGLRQKKYLIKNYADYNIDIIYCFVTGKTKEIEKKKISNGEWKTVTTLDSTKSLDIKFVKNLKNNGIKVAIGESPSHCVKKALFILNL